MNSFTVDILINKIGEQTKEIERLKISINNLHNTTIQQHGTILGLQGLHADNIYKREFEDLNRTKILSINYRYNDIELDLKYDQKIVKNLILEKTMNSFEDNFKDLLKDKKP